MKNEHGFPELLISKIHKAFKEYDLLVVGNFRTQYPLADAERFFGGDKLILKILSTLLLSILISPITLYLVVTGRLPWFPFPVILFGQLVSSYLWGIGISSLIVLSADRLRKTRKQTSL